MSSLNTDPIVYRPKLNINVRDLKELVRLIIIKSLSQVVHVFLARKVKQVHLLGLMKVLNIYPTSSISIRKTLRFEVKSPPVSPG